MASSRLRLNNISQLESEGNLIFSHSEKEKALTGYFRNILGIPSQASELIDLQALYPNSLDLSTLVREFSEKEIVDAPKEMHRDKSPGPDGFGAGFFQDF